MWGDISLWFWFAFPLWLVMLSIFSYVGWPSVCLFVFFKILFIYLRASTSGGEGQKARENQTSCWAGSPMWGLIPGPQDHDLSRRRHPTNWDTQVPPNTKFFKKTSSYLGCSNFLLDMSLEARETKAKMNFWDFIKIKTFCTAKETVNKTKIQPIEWNEVICKWHFR